MISNNLRSVVLIVASISTSCAGTWQQKANQSVYYSFEALQTARSIIRDYYLDKCTSVAKNCVENSIGEKDCVEAFRCKEEHVKVNDMLRAATFVASDAQLAIGVGKQGDAEGVVRELTRLLGQIRKQMNILKKNEE